MDDIKPETLKWLQAGYDARMSGYLIVWMHDSVGYCGRLGLYIVLRVITQSFVQYEMQMTL